MSMFVLKQIIYNLWTVSLYKFWWNMLIYIIFLMRSLISDFHCHFSRLLEELTTYVWVEKLHSCKLTAKLADQWHLQHGDGVGKNFCNNCTKRLKNIPLTFVGNFKTTVKGYNHSSGNIIRGEDIYVHAKNDWHNTWTRKIT